MKRSLEPLGGEYQILKIPLKHRDQVLTLIQAMPEDELVSISLSKDEVSVLLREESAFPLKDFSDFEVSKGWIAFKVAGPIPFQEVGVLSGILVPLTAKKIGIFAVSTFNTDYVLLKNEHRMAAIQALQESGYEVRGD